jgi:outer membrane lipoprotein-sorting protein
MSGPDDGRPAIRSRLLPILVVAALLAASGCSTYGAPSEADSALPSQAEAADRYASLETLNATVTTVQTRNNNTMTTVAQKRLRLDPWAYRDRVLAVQRTEGAREPLVSEGGFVVVNESRFVYFDPASEQVTRATIRGSTDSEESPFPRLVNAARSGQPVTRPTTTPGVSSLPRVPVESGSEEDGNGSTSYREGTVSVTYTGTEMVDGRAAYRLELTPNSAEMSLESQTLWLDTEYLYPVKRHTRFTAHGDDYEYTVTFRNVTFNPSFEPGTFRVSADDVPASASEVQFREYDSAAAMADAVDVPVPEPTVPEGFSLESATHRTANPELVSLRYERPNGDDTIRIFVFGSATNDTSGTPVEIGPYEARRSQTNDTTSIEWVADGYTFRVEGQVDVDTLTRVARSVVDTT